MPLAKNNANSSWGMSMRQIPLSIRNWEYLGHKAFRAQKGWMQGRCGQNSIRSSYKVLAPVFEARLDAQFKEDESILPLKSIKYNAAQKAAL
jgi:hypothetical protein